MNIAVRTDDRFVKVDGRSVRHLEEGSGVPAILLHGSSLGSSADVFRRNLRVLGGQGIRAIAFDLPGFGKSEASDDLSGGYEDNVPSNGLGIWHILHDANKNLIEFANVGQSVWLEGQPSLQRGDRLVVDLDHHPGAVVVDCYRSPGALVVDRHRRPRARHRGRGDVARHRVIGLWGAVVRSVGLELDANVVT
jgi:hypothetical protein